MDICAAYAYHGGAAICGDCFTLGSSRVGTIVDGEITSNSPLGSAYGLSGLVEFGGHIEIVDGWWSTVDTVKAYQGINLEIREMEVNVNRVEADEEVDEDFLFLFRYMFKESLSPDISRGERSGDTDVESKGLGVDITNIDTAFVSEENGIAIAIRVDAYVELGV